MKSGLVQIQWHDLFSCQIFVNSNVFSLFLGILHVALLVCKSSDIWDMILSNGKHVKKKKRKLNYRGICCFSCASNLKGKREKWLIGMQWG